ncbi:dynactin subunit 2-A-like [Argopecten irradians]|uniref:dynactin subunit 2-A-like n=1 Tax=Argopecten irradians TaxID=31199 RepID=UPI00371EA371
MADPKYANLPGIDLNSPDVFETSDLPEDDQALKSEPVGQEEVPNENIDKITLDTKGARTKFEGKDLQTGSVDFSDKISGHFRTGYDASKTEYEMLEEGAGKIESPQQKFQRLQHEIRELSEEVRRIQENVKQESTTEKMTPVSLGKQLEYLQHQLNDLNLEKVLGPEAGINLADPQGALQKRLMSQLDSYQGEGADAKGKTQAKGKAAGTSDCVTYELFYRPEQAQFSKNARLASLEERLERLEAAIGQNQDKLSVLTADTANKSLVGAVAVVNSKLSLLEQANIDQVEARLQGVLHKLKEIAEKKASVQDDPEKLNKIAELYDLVKKWNSVSETLPQVVDRLTALKELHEQALQFSQSLSFLDTAQQEIATSLNTHGDMLKQLQGTFKQNMDVIKTNCASLDSRIKTLQK